MVHAEKSLEGGHPCGRRSRLPSPPTLQCVIIARIERKVVKVINFPVFGVSDVTASVSIQPLRFSQDEGPFRLCQTCKELEWFHGQRMIFGLPIIVPQL